MTKTVSALLIAAACTSVLVAQSDDAKVAQEKNSKNSPKRYVDLDECIGAKVTMRPTAEARREAAKDNEKADKPTAEVVDIIVRAKDGNAEFALVSFGGLLGIGDKTVAVPCSALSWNGTKECYELSADKKQLEKLPAFDLAKAKKNGLDNAIHVSKTQWESSTKGGKVMDATGERSQAGTTEKDGVKAGDKVRRGTLITGTTIVAAQDRVLCASEIDDYPVHCREKECGKISKSIFDRNTGSIAFVVVSHGGVLGIGDDELLIPFKALNLGKKDKETVVLINKSEKDLKTCTPYKKPEKGVLDPKDAERAQKGMSRSESDKDSEKKAPAATRRK